MADHKNIGPMVEALQNARDWYPRLAHIGQRDVLGAMLTFLDRHGRMTPTAPQIAAMVDKHEQTVLKLNRELKQLGVLVVVNRRPNLTADGIPHGASIPIYSISPAPLEVRLSSGHPNLNGASPEPGAGFTRTSEGSPLEVGNWSDEQP